MTDQIVITEKSSQAKDVRAAVGSRYGAVLPAEGHLLDLCEPEDVNPAWKRWSAVLLRPDELYGTKPASGGNKAAKLKAIRLTADRVSLGCQEPVQGCLDLRPLSLHRPTVERADIVEVDIDRQTVEAEMKDVERRAALESKPLA